MPAKGSSVSASPHARALSGSLLLVLVACGGTEPSGRIAADIKAGGADETLTVVAGTTFTLDWASENATSCLITPGGWTGTTGSATVEDLTATTTYQLSCTGPGGEDEDTIQVVVTPRGTEIVFQAGDSANTDIYTVNADGSGLSRLIDNPAGDWAPSWSADGRRIYFLSYNPDGSGISGLYVMNADGTGIHLVAEGVTEPYAVSRDGTRIAMGVRTGAPYANVDLFVMNSDGSERTRVLDLPCEYYDYTCRSIESLAWSPDGQRIAYSAGSQGHGFVHYNYLGVVNADGTGQLVLSTSGRRDTDPGWAPDGQRIAFSSSLANPSYIFTPLDLEVINADGTGRMVVLAGAEAHSPSWSPDGQSIVFAQFSPGTDWVPPGHSELFAVNLDGTGLRHVTDAPGGAFAPDWNPAGP
jgi:Tol biopolymer transport system component